MKNQFFIISFLFILTNSLMSQVTDDGYPLLTFKADNSLKEILEYKIEGLDSSLISKGYYSDGLLRLKQGFRNDTLLIEYKFKYNENGRLDFLSKSLKDKNCKDTTKTISFFLYDQYGNIYFERVSDSIYSNQLSYENNFEMSNTYFTSYIYEDSLMTYSNFVTLLEYGIQHWSKKFEYDDKNRLAKFIYTIWVTVSIIIA